MTSAPTISPQYTYSLANPCVTVNLASASLQLQVAGPAMQGQAIQYGPKSFTVCFPIGSASADLASSVGAGITETQTYTVTMQVPLSSGETKTVTSTWTARLSASSSADLTILEFSTEDSGIPTGCSYTFTIGPFTSNPIPAGSALMVSDSGATATVSVTKETALEIVSFTPSNPHPSLCEQITLNWTVIGGVSVALDGGELQQLTGPGPHEGSFSVQVSPALMAFPTGAIPRSGVPSCPIDGAQPVQTYPNTFNQKIFTLQLKDENNTTTEQVTTISLMPVFASLTTDPSTVNWGESTTVSWSVANSDGVWAVTTPENQVLASSPKNAMTGSVTFTPSDCQSISGAGTDKGPYTVTLTLKAGGYHSANVQTLVTISPVLLSDLEITPSGTVSANQTVTLSWTADSAKSLTLYLSDSTIDVTGKDSYTFSPGTYSGTASTLDISLVAEGVSDQSVKLSLPALQIEPVKIQKVSLSTISPGKVIGVYAESQDGTKTVPFNNKFSLEWETVSATKVYFSGGNFSKNPIYLEAMGSLIYTSAVFFPAGIQLGSTYSLTAEGPEGPAGQTFAMETEGSPAQTILLGPAYLFNGSIETNALPYCGLINPPYYFSDSFNNNSPLDYTSSTDSEGTSWTIQALGISSGATLTPAEKDLPLKSFGVQSENGTTTITFPGPIAGLTITYPFGPSSGTCQILESSVVFSNVTEPFVFQMNAPSWPGVYWYAAPS